MNDQVQQHEQLRHAWLPELPAERYTHLMSAVANLQIAYASYDLPTTPAKPIRLTEGTLVGHVGAMAAEHSAAALAEATKVIDKSRAETVTRIMSAEEARDQQQRLAEARVNYERSAQAYRPQPAASSSTMQPVDNTNFALAA